MQVIWSSKTCSLEKGCECWLIFLSVLLSCGQIQYFVALFLRLWDGQWVILEWKFLEGTEKMGRRQSKKGENWEDFLSFYCVLLAPVVVDEDLFYLVLTYRCCFSSSLKGALKQVKQCSLRQDSPLGTPAKKTKKHFFFFYSCFFVVTVKHLSVFITGQFLFFVENKRIKIFNPEFFLWIEPGRRNDTWHEFLL